MRLMGRHAVLPAILFGLALAAIFGPGIWAVTLALSVATVPLMARIVRGAALVVMQQDYIEAARVTGMSNARLIRRHLAPNCVSPIFVFATLRFGQVILLGAALSFLGLGAQPPVAEEGWGRDGERRTQLPVLAPHIAVIPCIAIFIVGLAFNVLGDALRDALDPRLRV
ncbi:MAG: ABC transporter permease [Acetobacteraceae bacterium]